MTKFHKFQCTVDTFTLNNFINKLIVCLTNIYLVINIFLLFFHLIDDTEENTSEFWKASAQSTLRNQVYREINNNSAKNIILFIGDGMSLPTITAARIFLGQQKGLRGEEDQLSFEKFPFVGLSKVCSKI